MKLLTSVTVSIITVAWTMLIVGAVSLFAYQYGWWSVGVLIIFGMWMLNILYFVLALPSLLIFFVKNRSRITNNCVAAIYIIGTVLTIIVPWYTITDNFSVSNSITAIITNVVLFIFYKRKIFEVYEKD